MTWQTESDSSEQTEQLGERLAAHLKLPVVIELVADLGGGKTTFVKGLARGLGCSEQITSPTFTISREYNCNEGAFIHHFDFYRLMEAGVIAEALHESITNPRVVTVVEWGDIVHEVLPTDRITVTIELRPDSDTARRLTFTYTDTLQNTIKALEDDWSRL